MAETMNGATGTEWQTVAAPGRYGVSQDGTMTVAVARKKIEGLRRHADMVRYTVGQIGDSDTAAEAGVVTLSLVESVRDFLSAVSAADVIEYRSALLAQTFLQHADAQTSNALSRHYEVERVKGHLSMAVAMADRLLRALQGDVVMKS